MGLTCSVLGHHYGERDRIEERDRQGSEVVVTERAVKTCRRCGHELVVSESKEVTAVSDPPTASEEPSPDAAAPKPEQTSVPEERLDVQEEAPEDDGVILEDETPDREPGEWPPVETDQAETPGSEVDWPTDESAPVEEETADAELAPAWPAVDDEDEGFDAVAHDEDDELDGDVIEAFDGATTATNVEETAAGFVRAGPMERPADPGESELHTEYYCPQCDWAAESLKASVRRGDVCPDCKQGYVGERATR